MKGLLKNNFVGVTENIKVLFPVIIILGAMVSVAGNASLLNMFSLALSPVLSILSILCLRKETISKWQQYKVVLPVKRKTIVKSYYVSHLCWCAAGMAGVAVFMGAAVMLHGNQYFYYGFRDAVTLVLGGGVMAVLTGAVFYPLYYLLGTEKIEITAIMSLILSAFIIAGLSILINTLTGGNISDMTYYLSLALIMGVTGIFYVCSCLLSTCLFYKKEY